MKRFIMIVSLHLLVFLILIVSYSYAEDKIFTCKPVVTGVPMKNGDFYIEKEYDENTPMLNALTTTQFLINDEVVYYKNNKNRQFEQLIPSDYFFNRELSKEEKFLREIEDTLAKWDQMLKLENFKSFYLLYRSFADDGNSNHSIKRISINKKITVHPKSPSL